MKCVLFDGPISLNGITFLTSAKMAAFWTIFGTGLFLVVTSMPFPGQDQDRALVRRRRRRQQAIAFAIVWAAVGIAQGIILPGGRLDTSPDVNDRGLYKLSQADNIVDPIAVGKAVVYQRLQSPMPSHVPTS